MSGKKSPERAAIRAAARRRRHQKRMREFTFDRGRSWVNPNHYHVTEDTPRERA